MNDSLKTALVLVGRVLLALIFVTSGYAKLAGIEGTAGYIASVGLPWPTALAAAAGVFELGAGLALVVGFKTRWAAFALGAFTILASLLFHAYWAAPADQEFVQQLMFMKNLAIAGGLFIVAAFGAGRLGLDGRAARA